MGKVLDNKCPNCMAPIAFNATLGKWKCEYCDGVFSVEDMDKAHEQRQKFAIENDDVNYVNYHCPDCGAEIIADENTAATFCIYCGNTAILRNKLSGDFAPSMIIPFKTEKSKAVLEFKNLSKGRPLMPRSFNNESNIEKITGLYIPFWLYDISVSGSIEAEGVKTSSWTVGDTHYTKNDYYQVIRDGKMVFKKIPVDGSTRFANDIMNSLEPFYFHYLVPYNHAYLAGYLAEKYDVSSDDAFVDAEKRSLSSARDVFTGDMNHYSSLRQKNDSLLASREGTSYVLLPVWMVNVKYRDKYYTFAMNGQTGEFLGDIPVDKRRVIVYSFLIFLTIFVVIIVASYLFFLIGG